MWWIRFRQHGKTVRQSTETTSESKAQTFLREREGKVALNIPVNVEAADLTQAALAARAKVARPYITMLEPVVREPSIVTVVNLAKALGVPVTALLE